MKHPHKKVSKNPLGGSISEALTSQFELDFTLITCIVTSMMGSLWYLESGALIHMTEIKSSLVTWRIRTSKCTSIWEMMGGIV